MVRDILKILMYEEDPEKVTQKIIMHAREIRTETVQNEPNRHFERIAARRDFKWYHTGYTNQYTKKAKNEKALINKKNAEIKALKRAEAVKIKEEKRATKLAEMIKIREEKKATKLAEMIKIREEKKATKLAEMIKIREEKKATAIGRKNKQEKNAQKDKIKKIPNTEQLLDKN